MDIKHNREIFWTLDGLIMIHYTYLGDSCLISSRNDYSQVVPRENRYGCIHKWQDVLQKHRNLSNRRHKQEHLVSLA